MSLIQKSGIFLLCVFLGCSGNKMDMSTAEGLVKYYFTDGTSRIFVNIGRIGTACPFLNTKVGAEDILLNLNPEADFSMVFAQLAGYVTVTPDGDGYWKSAFTDKGQNAVNAAGHQPQSNAALNGCDYQIFVLDLASADLVKIAAVNPGEKTTEIDYIWKWKTTELGRGLREDGKLYTMLTPLQRETLKKQIRGGFQKVSLPVPPEDFTQNGSIQARKGPDGWHVLLK
ncbi:MAG TPA: hypothetical protein VGK24_09170 [Candidatus Angelobacter sp.]